MGGENQLITGTVTVGSGTVSISGTVTTAGTATISPTGGTLTDRSGTLTTAATSQQIAPANPSRRYLLIQNVSTTEILWVNFTAAATQAEPSIMLAANGGSLVMESSSVSTEAVNVIAATAGHPWTAKEM